jgi:hypothetical protein
MALHPAGTPVIRTCTRETDVDTTAQSVVDMNSFAIPPRGTSDKDLAKWRKEVLAYVGTQLDMLVSRSADTFDMEVGKA